jgi:DNA-binding CsgD family transcriptional regulator
MTAEFNDLTAINWWRDQMVACNSCGVSIEKGEEFEHLGRTLCEDCYLDALNPPKACDPWAVHTAKSSMAQGQELTPLQERILMLLKDRGPLTAQEVMSELKISESEFKNNFATLRHMELARGFKENGKVSYTLFSS